ncbi:MAG: class I SAM-dependent methyltransferase [Anaerolineae bacterium]|nr:class I SAM-dependent methyltransferase [Anaerolineae bacterium]
MEINNHNLKPYFHNIRWEMVVYIPDSAKRILDVGCYSGAFGELLKKNKSLEIWGIEPNIEASRDAEKVLDRVICGYFTKELNLPDSYFDVIVMNDVLEHMIDPWAALELAKKKLDPNGRIIISLPNIRHIDNLIHLFIDQDFRYELNGIRDKTHLRFFTKKSAIRLINNCGFEIEKIEGINEKWWTNSIIRRLAYRIFHKNLDDTKYIQFAFVIKKSVQIN